MNKTLKKSKILIVFCILQCLLFFNISCGLETFEVIEPPSKNSYPDYPDVVATESVMEQDFYFLFETQENESYSEVVLKGTDVYYKIYNDKSRALSEKNTLVLLSEDEEYSNTAPDKMRSYGYVPLKYNNQTSDVLISANGINRKVKIRLSNYSDQYACVQVNDVTIGSPIRNLQNTSSVRTFDFINKDTEQNSIPYSGDSDYYYSSSSDQNEFYIVAFAVSVARDINFSEQYSNITYLGSVYSKVKTN